MGNGDVFTSMMLAAWIRRFTPDNPVANKVAEQWSDIISSAFVSGCLNKKTEMAVMDYVIHKDSGIYYVYENEIAVLPQSFASKNASRYLAAVELLSKYKHAKVKLNFVIEWLNNNRNENGRLYGTYHMFDK